MQKVINTESFLFQEKTTSLRIKNEVKSEAPSSQWQWECKTLIVPWDMQIETFLGVMTFVSSLLNEHFLVSNEGWVHTKSLV